MIKTKKVVAPKKATNSKAVKELIKFLNENFDPETPITVRKLSADDTKRSELLNLLNAIR